MRIVLLGPPASGKGTQGRRLADRLGLHYLSTGALLRQNVESCSELGRLAKPILEQGGYLPDELMSPILGAWLESHPKGSGWVLDGFPRSLPQANFLNQWLSINQMELSSAISLEAPCELLLERIGCRVECSSCSWSGQRKNPDAKSACPECGFPAESRPDDDPENFRKRYSEFVRFTLPVVEFYQTAGKLHTFSAISPETEIAEAVYQKLGLPRLQHTQ